MKKFVLIFTILAIISIPAFAASNWVQALDKKYVDTNSLRKENYLGYNYGNYYSFWWKELNDGSNAFTQLENYYKSKVWYIKTQYYIDCNNKKWAIKSSIDYGIEDNVLGHFDYNDYQLRFMSVVPDTRSEFWYEYACQYSKGGY